jgi:hypothetical protein
MAFRYRDMAFRLQCRERPFCRKLHNSRSFRLLQKHGPYKLPGLAIRAVQILGIHEPAEQTVVFSPVKPMVPKRHSQTKEREERNPKKERVCERRHFASCAFRILDTA